MPVPGGTTLKSANACWPQRRNAYRSRLRSNSSSTLRTKASGRPAMSATTEWSMTSSAGARGLMRVGSPPRGPMASRMAARSTMAGTPVKSCIRTRAGEKAISRSAAEAGSQRANASTSSAVTALPSSLRSRFSSSTLSENGSPATSPTEARASSRKTSSDRSPTSNPARAPKLFPAMVPALRCSRVVALSRVPGRRAVQRPTVPRPVPPGRRIGGHGPPTGRRLAGRVPAGLGAGRQPGRARPVHHRRQLPFPPAAPGPHRPRRRRRLLGPGHRRPAGRPGPLRRPGRRRRPGRGRVVDDHGRRGRAGHPGGVPAADLRRRRPLPRAARMLAPGRGSEGSPAGLGPPGPGSGAAAVREHARRWAEGYERAWRAADPEAAAALYAPGAHYRSEPFRDPHLGRGGVLAYTRAAYATEADQDPRFGVPFASPTAAAVEWWATTLEQGQPATLIGTSVLTFTPEGLVATARDYWFLESGRHQPFEGWGR